MTEKIDGNTTVSMTMTQLAIVLGSIVGGMYLVLNLTTSSMKEDVSVMRQTVLQLQTADKESAVKLRDTELKLAESLSQLKVSIERLDGRVASFDNKLDGFNKSMEGLSARLNETQKLLAIRQTSLSDPKALDSFAAALRKTTNLDDTKIVVVPFAQ